MQKIIIIVKVTTFIILPIFINSCVSSSYSERYGNESGDVEDYTATNSANPNDSEEELDSSASSVSSDEAEEIIDKLSDIIQSNNKKKKFLFELVSYLNTPYRYGGESKRGIDCSAFTQIVYRNSLNINIPRTAREQYRSWKIFNNKNDLKFGDLIYFNTSKRYFPGHVGIYLDDNLFAHASSSKGVIVSSLEDNYFSNKFVGANRIKINKPK